MTQQHQHAQCPARRDPLLLRLISQECAYAGSRGKFPRLCQMAAM